MIRAALLGAVVLALATWPASAREIPGALAYKGWTVAGLELRGAPDGLAGPLHDGLALAGQKRLLGRRRAVFFVRTLEDDLRRTLLLLARSGYPAAECAVEFTVTDAERRRVTVTLVIDAGPPVRIAEVVCASLPAGFAAPGEAALGLAAGQILADDHVHEAARRLESALQRAGYAFAAVAPRLTRPDSLRAVVHLEADPGPQVRFGTVRVTGIAADLVPLVIKTLALPRGRRYHPVPLQQGREALLELGLFRQVRLVPRLAGADTVDVTADLLPRKPRLLEVSAGYWTDEYLRVRARWQHRNLLGGGRGVEVRGSASRFRQDAGTSFWWPALLGPRTRVSATLAVRAENEDSYNLSGRQLELAASWRPVLRTALRAGVALDDVRVDPAAVAANAFQEEGGLSTVFSLRWERDSVDDRIWPARGGFLSAGTTWSPAGFLSDNHFLILQSRAVRYWPAGHGVVAAARLDLGWARPLGESEDLLPDRRFYAGGSTSMRGARRRMLGPRDAAGAPIGGEAMTVASAELRIPLFWKVRGALFVDAGQVWARRQDVNLGDLEAAAGPGLMVTTPVGPIRADLAWNLTERPGGEPRWVLHLGIGHPF